MERNRRPSDSGASSDGERRISEIERDLARLQSSVDALKRLDPSILARADDGEVKPADETDIYAEAVETFGSADKATLWLNRPTTVFDGRAPAEILSEKDGPRRVRVVLGRIAHGLFA